MKSTVKNKQHKPGKVHCLQFLSMGLQEIIDYVILG